jgi:hypothetical protein
VVVEREAALDKDIESLRLARCYIALRRSAARGPRTRTSVGPRFAPHRPPVVCLSLRRLALKKVDRWIVHEAL